MATACETYDDLCDLLRTAEAANYLDGVLAAHGFVFDGWCPSGTLMALRVGGGMTVCATPGWEGADGVVAQVNDDAGHVLNEDAEPPVHPLPSLTVEAYADTLVEVVKVAVATDGRSTR